ncbi:hypothetical protein ABFB09_01920 [Dehalogenimonas sp. THU2]|uniref:hypothetical protein n=1 Tax=Dehalogenimonas sp. THU2 TaxID=3151121 RepID=UPI0032183FE1
MTTKIIRDPDFKRVAAGVKPDAKHRVVLKKVDVLPDVTYHVYTNRLGQIVLDPQVTVPASEAWLYANPEAIAAVRRGLADAAAGKLTKIDTSTL